MKVSLKSFSISIHNSGEWRWGNDISFPNCIMTIYISHRELRIFPESFSGSTIEGEKIITLLKNGGLPQRLIPIKETKKYGIQVICH